MIWRILLGSRIARWLAVAVAAAAILAILAGWLRNDAVSDDRAAQEAQRAQDRLTTITEDRRRDDEIDSLDTDGLRERALEWLHPAP